MTLSLDRRVPFVDAVARIVAGRASVTDAADVLWQAQRRHGLLLLGGMQTVALEWMHVPKKGAQSVTLEQAFGMLQDKEAFDAHFDSDDTREAEWCDRVFFPFLDDTWLLVDGGFFSSECGILTSEPVAVKHSYRSWGHTLADWANSRGVPRPSGAWEPERREWGYLDFYMTEYLAPLLEDGARWLSTVHEVLHVNARRLEANLARQR